MKNVKFLFLVLLGILFTSVSLTQNKTSAVPVFFLLKEFTFTAPSGCDKSDYLKNFTKNHEKEFYYLDKKNMTDKNFSKVSATLIPGRKYLARLLKVNKNAHSLDYLMRSLWTGDLDLLVGVQGLAAVYEAAKDELPKNNWYLCFDYEENLWKDSKGAHRVPVLYCSDAGEFGFHLDCFERSWCNYYTLIVFRHCP